MWFIDADEDIWPRESKRQEDEVIRARNKAEREHGVKEYSNSIRCAESNLVSVQLGM